MSKIFGLYHVGVQFYSLVVPEFIGSVPLVAYGLYGDFGVCTLVHSVEKFYGRNCKGNEHKSRRDGPPHFYLLLFDELSEGWNFVGEQPQSIKD